MINSIYSLYTAYPFIPQYSDTELDPVYTVLRDSVLDIRIVIDIPPRDPHTLQDTYGHDDLVCELVGIRIDHNVEYIVIHVHSGVYSFDSEFNIPVYVYGPDLHIGRNSYCISREPLSEHIESSTTLDVALRIHPQCIVIRQAPPRLIIPVYPRTVWDSSDNAENGYPDTGVYMGDRFPDNSNIHILDGRNTSITYMDDHININCASGNGVGYYTKSEYGLNLPYANLNTAQVIVCEQALSINGITGNIDITGIGDDISVDGSIDENTGTTYTIRLNKN